MTKIKNKISVIISAHERKDFIMDAINSVIEQTLDKNLYEIIVIKNFKDEKIDKFINSKKIKNLYYDSNKKSGIKNVDAINNSTGNIICFLDDDDLFRKDKLQKVYDLFSDGKVGMYHNGRSVYYKNKIIKDQWEDGGVYHLTGKDKFTFEDKKFLSKHAFWFNTSSLSLRKDIIDTDILGKVSYTLDYYLAFIGINSKLDSIFDNDPLTIYRVHDTNMSFKNNYDYNSFCKFSGSYNTSRLTDQQELLNYMKGTKCECIINKYVLKKLLGYLLFSEEIKGARLRYLVISTRLFNIDIKFKDFKGTAETFFGCILFLISKGLMRRVTYNLFYRKKFEKRDDILKQVNNSEVHK